MCASLFAILTAAVEVDGTRMSRTGVWDQFVCRVWLTRMPLWASLAVSTYAIILTAFERYAAVVYPIWYQVRNYDTVGYVSLCIGRVSYISIYLCYFCFR